MDTDAKVSAKLLKKQDDELSRVLKETVPGLVTSGPVEGSMAHQVSGSALLDDRLIGALGQHHRTLIAPDALHVTVLFQPTFSWLDRVNSRFPSSLAVSTSNAQSLLDDFVLEVYLPQLEEKVQTVFQESVSAPDAFHEDPGWKALSSAPLVKVIIFPALGRLFFTLTILTGHHKSRRTNQFNVCDDASDTIPS